MSRTESEKLTFRKFYGCACLLKVICASSVKEKREEYGLKGIKELVCVFEMINIRHSKMSHQEEIGYHSSTVHLAGCVWQNIGMNDGHFINLFSAQSTASISSPSHQIISLYPFSFFISYWLCFIHTPFLIIPFLLFFCPLFSLFLFLIFFLLYVLFPPFSFYYSIILLYPCNVIAKVIISSLKSWGIHYSTTSKLSADSIIIMKTKSFIWILYLFIL